MKKKITPILLSFLALSACSNFSFGNNNSTNNGSTLIHEHTFDSDWSYDNEYHWHAATCEHVDQVNSRLLHNFSDWSVINEPTTESEGLKTRKCLTCKYTQNEAIAKIIKKGTSINNPYSIDEAINLMEDYEEGQVSQEEYYLSGEAVSVSYNSQYDSYYIYFKGHTLTDANPFQLYSGILDLNLVDPNFSDEDLIGQTIIIHGYLKLFRDNKNNLIYEMSYLKDIESPTGRSTSPQIVGIGNVIHTHTYSTIWSSDNIYHWHDATCEHTNEKSNYEMHDFGEWQIDSDATASSTGKKHRNCVTCNYKEEEIIPMITNGTGSFTLYTFNDFHGAVNEYSSQRHAGLARFGTYLKQVSNGNTVIVDSGDTFQGSIESNYNNGALITDVFNYAHVDVHTLGNHDFDWGQDKIVANKARINSSDNWHSAYLGANIYDYNFDTKVNGNTQQSRLGEKYHIKTLDNGLKIGIIGVIGADQITSICSPLVSNICFKNEITSVQNLSDELRTKKGCDIVIASVHGSATDTMDKGLTNVSPVSGKKYVDYVACGHSHQNEEYVENGVFYTQAACYGEMIYKATFDVSNGTVTNTNVTPIDYSDIKSATTTIDSNIQSIINNYGKDYSSIGKEVIAKSTSGKFYKSEQMSNLLCKAVFNEANNQGFNVDISVCNTARYDLSGTSWTYANLYEAFPFDNAIYICRMRGNKNIRQLCYNGNSCYHNSSLTSMSTSSWYTVAIIDYLLFHTNSSRTYDYYTHDSNNLEIVGILKKANGENANYRDVCANYLRSTSTTLYSSNFSNSVAEFVKPSY